MECFYTFKMTGNPKLGAMPVINSSFEHCSQSCTHMINGTCYAKGRVSWNNDKRERLNLKDLSYRLLALPDLSKVRLFEIGDIPLQEKNSFLAMLIHFQHVSRLRFFGYTHHENINDDLIQLWSKIHIRRSIECLPEKKAEFHALINQGVPLALTCRKEEIETKKIYIIGQKKIIICPSSLNKSIQCINCNLCFNSRFIIAFPLHGDCSKAKALRVLNDNMVSLKEFINEDNSKL